MSSSWRREIEAVFRKELQTELRTKSGLITAGLFSIVTVVALAFAAYDMRLTGTLAGGMIWVSILFAQIVSLPRIFLVEEELGTMDLLRLTARPHAVFWGKSLFAMSLAILTGLLLSGLFLAFVSQPVPLPLLFLLTIVGGSACLSSSVALCGALVLQSSSRYALAGAIAVPLLLQVVVMAVSATRVALGDGFLQQGINSTIGLYLYAIASQTIGPGLFALVWKC